MYEKDKNRIANLREYVLTKAKFVLIEESKKAE